MKPTSKLILPQPTCSRPDPSKKSHARRQPPGHIPRPRNAFILFRCDFVRQKKIPHSVETDHRNISRIVGRIWREMSTLERQPWVDMADAEKTKHMKDHPGYRFTRGLGNSKRRSRREDEAPPVPKEQSFSLSFDESQDELDRSSSCPVGLLHVPTVNLEFSNGYGAPLKIRDDLERRPSRVTLYQSTPNALQADTGHHFFADIMNQHYYAQTVKERLEEVKKEHEDYAAEENEISDDEHDPASQAEGTFCGPRLNAVQYPMPGLDWKDDYPTELWAGSYAGTPANDGFLRDPPVFTDPFSSALLSTLPPLPRSMLPFSFDETPRASFLAERKTSNFFSPRSGKWKLPPIPTHNPGPSVFPSGLNPSFAGHGASSHYRFSSSRKPFDDVPELTVARKLAEDTTASVLEEFHKDWLSDI